MLMVQTVFRTGVPKHAPVLRILGWRTVSETCDSTAHRFYRAIQRT